MARFHVPALAPLSQMGTVDDRALVARIRAGDAQAFEQVFLAYYDDMVYLARQYVGSRDEAEEMVQGILAATWERRENLSVRGPLKVYLLGAVRNRSLNAARDARVRQAYVERSLTEFNLDSLESDPIPTDRDAEARDLRDVVRRAINDLPKRARECVTLHVWHGLSYAEVGEMIGISEKTVQTHVVRALQRMRLDPSLRIHL